MYRRRRTEILINGSMKVAQKMSLEINEKYNVKTIEKPNSGLVMIKMRENSKKSLFYLGEVLVTEAKVEINGKLGLGIVKGDESELAYWLAVIDAAYSANLEETKKWEEILRDEEKIINEKLKKHEAEILRTKVNFDTMSN